MPLIAIIVQESGLTLDEVIAGIPHDAPAFVGYALLAGFLYFVWRGSRKRPDKQP